MVLLWDTQHEISQTIKSFIKSVKQKCRYSQQRNENEKQIDTFSLVINKFIKKWMHTPKKVLVTDHSLYAFSIHNRILEVYSNPLVPSQIKNHQNRNSCFGEHFILPVTEKEVASCFSPWSTCYSFVQLKCLAGKCLVKQQRY